MKEILPIPEQFLQPCEHPGRLQTMHIPSFSNATVYVPADYNREGDPYPTFYLLHGGGGDEHSFFSEDGELKNMLDHMIEKKKIEPMIVVCPTYYPPGKKGEGIAYSGEAVRDFGPIVRNKIIPLVEEKFRTGGDRWLRGIGGFSMGAVATWYALMAGVERFRWFMPMSGDCWICGERGGGEHPKQTAELIAVTLSGKDYYVHALTGDKDIAFPNLDPQMKAMLDMPEDFKKTVKYSVLKGGVHDYPDIRRYIYNALPEFFR